MKLSHRTNRDLKSNKRPRFVRSSRRLPALECYECRSLSSVSEEGLTHGSFVKRRRVALCGLGGHDVFALDSHCCEVAWSLFVENTSWLFGKQTCGEKTVSTSWKAYENVFRTQWKTLGRRKSNRQRIPNFIWSLVSKSSKFGSVLILNDGILLSAGLGGQWECFFWRERVRIR